MSKDKLNLLVYTDGKNSFVGDCEHEQHEAEEMIDKGVLITVLNAFPIGKATMMGQNGAPVDVPALGVFHWCKLEPVKRHRVRPTSYYWVDDQSEESQELFLEAYTTYIERLGQVREQASNLIQSAKPEALEQIDKIAKEAGVPPAAVMSAILDSSIKQGKP